MGHGNDFRLYFQVKWEAFGVFEQSSKKIQHLKRLTVAAVLRITVGRQGWKQADK